MAKDKKTKQGAVELGPDSDPRILYNNYVKECKAIGLEPYGPLKDVLTNEQNPNRGKQIIILPPSSEGDGALGPGGCRALVNAMIAKDEVPFTGCSELRICRSSIKDGGATALGSLLAATACKRSLDPSDPLAVQLEWKLEYMELIDNDIGRDGACALGKSLSVGMNRTLVALVLDLNRTLGSDGVAVLCKGLSTNSTLKKLSVKHCNIDERGGKPIADMLRFARLELISLDLTSNQIGGLGLIDICLGLSQNTCLKTLRLADNSIGQTDDDARALKTFAGVLAKHPAIMAVDLHHNHIGNGGGTLLLPAVSANLQITEFKVDSKMDDQLFKSLFRASLGAKKKGKAKKGKKKKK